MVNYQIVTFIIHHDHHSYLMTKKRLITIPVTKLITQIIIKIINRVVAKILYKIIAKIIYRIINKIVNKLINKIINKLINKMILWKLWRDIQKTKKNFRQYWLNMTK